MPDNDELQFQLTDADRESLKNNSTYSLPDNPSDKEFSAAQIKKAMYYPSLMLFDWMKEGFDEYNEKFEEYDEKFDNKVDKIESVKIIYGTDATKANIGIQYSVDALADNIVQRNNVSEILVPRSTANLDASLSYSQFIEQINRLDDEDVKKTGSTMSGNIKFNNGFGLTDRINRNLISQNNDVDTVGDFAALLELKGSNIRTIDKILQKYNSTTGTSENYALISDVNTEKARAIAVENEIRDIAAGKAKTITISIVDNPDFNTEVELLTYLGTIKDINGKVWNQGDLSNGDSIFVVEQGAKDRWFAGNNKFYVLEADTSFLINYQKKLSNTDGTISIDHVLGTIKANITMANLTGNISENAVLSSAFGIKQDKATSYNFNADSSKTVFYQSSSPTHAPHGALWIYGNAGANVKFQDILGSIADNVTSDTYIKDTIKGKVNRSVICSLEPIYSGDVVQFKYLSVNLWEQNASYNTFNLNLANSTTAGLMSFEDYNTLIANTQKIAQLEGRLKRISYDVKDNPTASEIDAYVRGLGYTEEDFPYLKVIVYGTKHMWLYYTRPTARWQDDGIDAAGIFTNSVAGLIKGSAVAGKVYAESDGTGSVYGWDDLNNTVTSHGTAISNIQSDLPNYIQKTGGTFTGNINMGGHLINMVGGRIANVAVGTDDDAVPKKWITGQLANYIPTSGGTINGDLSITGTLTIGTFRLSGSLDANNNKIINLANPVNSTDGANKDYVDLAIDDLDDLISDEVEARTNADNLIMLTKTADPTTTDVGALGQLWKNTTNGKVFKCDSISGSTYSWSELGTGSFETDNSSIVKGSDGKYKVSYGGKFSEQNFSVIVGMTIGAKIDDNIYEVTSTSTPQALKVEKDNVIIGSFKIGGYTYNINKIVIDVAVAGMTTGTTLNGIGFKMVENILPDNDLYFIQYEDTSGFHYAFALTNTDISTYLPAVSDVQLSIHNETVETIKAQVIPVSNDFFYITNGVICPTYDKAIDTVSTRAPQTKAVGEALALINNVISTSASSTNKLLSESEINQKIALIEANQLYKTNAQGSFATKAELLAATAFFDAAGNKVTPTKNDVVYVLADEDHNNKTAKYEYVSISGTTITWGFVIAFTDLQLTEAQQNAIDSGITSEKIAEIDESLSDLDEKFDEYYTKTESDDRYIPASDAVKIKYDSTISITNRAALFSYFTETRGKLVFPELAFTIADSPDGTQTTIWQVEMIKKGNGAATLIAKKLQYLSGSTNVAGYGDIYTCSCLTGNWTTWRKVITSAGGEITGDLIINNSNGTTNFKLKRHDASSGQADLSFLDSADVRQACIRYNGDLQGGVKTAAGTNWWNGAGFRFFVGGGARINSSAANGTTHYNLDLGSDGTLKWRDNEVLVEKSLTLTATMNDGYTLGSNSYVKQLTNKMFHIHLEIDNSTARTGGYVLRPISQMKFNGNTIGLTRQAIVWTDKDADQNAMCGTALIFGDGDISCYSENAINLAASRTIVIQGTIYLN